MLGCYSALPRHYKRQLVVKPARDASARTHRLTDNPKASCLRPHLRRKHTDSVQNLQTEILSCVRYWCVCLLEPVRSDRVIRQITDWRFGTRARVYTIYILRAVICNECKHTPHYCQSRTGDFNGGGGKGAMPPQDARAHLNNPSTAKSRPPDPLNWPPPSSFSGSAPAVSRKSYSKQLPGLKSY